MKAGIDFHWYARYNDGKLTCSFDGYGIYVNHVFEIGLNFLFSLQVQLFRRILDANGSSILRIVCTKWKIVVIESTIEQRMTSFRINNWPSSKRARGCTFVYALDIARQCLQRFRSFTKLSLRARVCTNDPECYRLFRTMYDISHLASSRLASEFGKKR